MAGISTRYRICQCTGVRRRLLLPQSAVPRLPQGKLKPLAVGREIKPPLCLVQMLCFGCSISLRARVRMPARSEAKRCGGRRSSPPEEFYGGRIRCLCPPSSHPDQSPSAAAFDEKSAVRGSQAIRIPAFIPPGCDPLPRPASRPANPMSDCVAVDDSRRRQSAVDYPAKRSGRWYAARPDGYASPTCAVGFFIRAVTRLAIRNPIEISIDLQGWADRLFHRSLHYSIHLLGNRRRKQSHSAGDQGAQRQPERRRFIFHSKYYPLVSPPRDDDQCFSDDGGYCARTPMLAVG